MFQNDYARADAYGLAAALLAEPPGDAFLRFYAALPKSNGDEQPVHGFTLQPLELSPHEKNLRALQRACADCKPEEISAEYDAVFRGSGSPFTQGEGSQPRLLALRSHLASMGLPSIGSDADAAKYVAAACEVMRWLLEHDRPIELQRQFFVEFIADGVTALCGAIDAHPQARFYRIVSNLAQTFVASERQALELDPQK